MKKAGQKKYWWI